MPKFVIGIGSQRAGSTLLHRILDNCTDIFMHPVKELHYFDTLYSVRQEAVLRKYSKRQMIEEKKIPFKSFLLQRTSSRYKCFVRTLNLLSARSVFALDYPDLFNPCLEKKKWLGEVTPEYMVLPEEGVKNMVERVGPNAKIILIARNPTQRFISSVKLLKANNREQFPEEIFETELLKTMKTMPAWMRIQDRLNDYESALLLYKRYFENVLFLSYDGITQKIDKTHSALEDFLELPVNKKRFQNLLGKRINTIHETPPVSSKVIQLLDSRYQENICFLEGYFGAGNCIL